MSEHVTNDDHGFNYELSQLQGDGVLTEVQLGDGGWYPIKQGTFVYVDTELGGWAEFEVRGDPGHRRRVVKSKTVLGYAFDHDAEDTDY